MYKDVNKVLMLSLSIFVLIFPLSFLSKNSKTYKYDEEDLRRYIPILTNNITADKLYGREVRKGAQVAYEYLLYWNKQEGTYKFASHNHDWEFIVVYEGPNRETEQVNYDSWHYYIGREKNIECWEETNPLLYVNRDYHNFKPDIGMRRGNISWQIHKQKMYNLTEKQLNYAKSQVGFDKELYQDPFTWKEKGFLGRYTAFDSAWKSFWVVTDKEFGFIDLSDDERLVTKWL
ncbi:MAG: NPP1 family protein [Bacteroides sp.]|uniref:NPP1 family protein n=1 Tax=Bacteroides sp. TaxID=29523 RepID=UPI002FC3A42F